ncbi:Tat pathway signal protein [Microvirga terrestris]|uniref:Tat pathway signal protein n=1 Tax=Microvirga terrestris TaxID=2791024 RepID=A0ABS0HQR5_9HYPH|nr:Tat pathway signal protein [Microvirga terrestris]MBF9195823.1 Tat pathway signal protein [Microvirga terrestris]
MKVSTWNDPGYSTGGIWECLALLLPLSGAALAQEGASPSPLRIELNKIEAAGENCRTYFLINNQKGDSWRSLKLDLFALDTDGVAAKRLAVEVGSVPGRKTLIKLFDFPGLSCTRLGSVLLKDVMTCEGAANSREECLSALETSSKIDAVSFTK